MEVKMMPSSLFLALVLMLLQTYWSYYYQFNSTTPLMFCLVPMSLSYNFIAEVTQNNWPIDCNHCIRTSPSNILNLWWLYCPTPCFWVIDCFNHCKACAVWNRILLLVLMGADDAKI
jgi:hypothetical protein